MTWVKKRVTVITKAYPEPSRKHGDVACTAGITEDGEWIRMYPIDMRHFVGENKISKFDIIEVECEKDTGEKLGRKESHKIRPDSIKIVDRSLTQPKAEWIRRNALLLPKLNTSIESLQKLYEQDKTSLGLIRPKQFVDFIRTQELQKYENNSWSYTLTLDGQKIPHVTQIPHIFKYVFACPGCKDSVHTMQCEDWELFASYRSWGNNYTDLETLWAKLKEKYFDWMLKERDLYFVMGMYSQYPTWFIIGIYYPPKNKV